MTTCLGVCCKDVVGSYPWVQLQELSLVCRTRRGEWVSPVKTQALHHLLINVTATLFCAHHSTMSFFVTHPVGFLSLLLLGICSVPSCLPLLGGIKSHLINSRPCYHEDRPVNMRFKNLNQQV